MLGIPRTVARALIHDTTSDTYLLVYSSLAFLSNERGFFSLPGGGVERSEEPQDALVRELGEELGLEQSSIQSIEQIQTESPHYFQWIAAIPFKNTVYLYAIELNSTSTLLPNWEIQTYRWVSWKQLQTLLHPRFKALLYRK